MADFTANFTLSEPIPIEATFVLNTNYTEWGNIIGDIEDQVDLIQYINEHGGEYVLPTASTTVLGGVKVDGTTITIASGVISSTGSGGTTDYDDLTDKPQINSVILSGNKTSSDLGLQPLGDYATNESLTTGLAGKSNTNHNHALNNLSEKSYDSLTNKPSIPTKTSDITNDSGFISGYIETDPVFVSSSAHLITATDITTLGNTSGTNTGDETETSISSKYISAFPYMWVSHSSPQAITISTWTQVSGMVFNAGTNYWNNTSQQIEGLPIGIYKIYCDIIASPTQASVTNSILFRFYRSDNTWTSTSTISGTKVQCVKFETISNVTDILKPYLNVPITGNYSYAVRIERWR